MKVGDVMRYEVYQEIQSDKDYMNYLRFKPVWYKRLMRNPDKISEFQTECKTFFRKTIPDRVNAISNGVQLAQMMMTMVQSSNSGS